MAPPLSLPTWRRHDVPASAPASVSAPAPAGSTLYSYRDGRGGGDSAAHSTNVYYKLNVPATPPLAAPPSPGSLRLNGVAASGDGGCKAALRALFCLAVAVLALTAAYWQLGGARNGDGGVPRPYTASVSSSLLANANARFLLYTPGDSLGRQLLTVKAACAVAMKTNRTLVLPMVGTPFADRESTTNIGHMSWAPLERYMQLQPLRDMPCPTASLETVRQWLARHGRAAEPGTPALQYAVLARRSAATEDDMQRYYEDVAGLPHATPVKRLSLTSTAALTVDQVAVALDALARHPVLAVGTLTGTVLPGNAAADTDADHVLHAQITRGLVVQKRVRELARRIVGIAYKEARFVGVYASRSHADLKACNRLADENERALCRMPPLMVDGALYDIRTASAAKMTAQTPPHIPAVPVVPVPVPTYLATAVDQPLHLWNQILYGMPNVTVLVSPEKLLQYLALPEVRPLGLLTQFHQLDRTERVLLDVEICIQAAWFIGNPYCPLSLFIAEQRAAHNASSYFLTAASPYVVFGVDPAGR